MGLLLRSPMHGLLSDSILLIKYRGRTSGKNLVTPARYIRLGDLIESFTSTSGQWWRNVKEQSAVTLIVAGVSGEYRATVIIDQADKIEEALVRCLALYPEDAAYHDIKRTPAGDLDASDFERAIPSVVLIQWQQVM